MTRTGVVRLCTALQPEGPCLHPPPEQARAPAVVILCSRTLENRALLPPDGRAARPESDLSRKGRGTFPGGARRPDAWLAALPGCQPLALLHLSAVRQRGRAG